MNGEQPVSATLPLKDQLKALENLQELDLKIDSLNLKKQSFPEQLRVANEALAKLQKQISDKTLQSHELEKTLKQTIAALELNQDRSERTSKKLSAVSNTKEFQAANSEVAQLQKLHGTLTDQKTKTEAEIAALKTEIASLESQCEDVKKACETQAQAVAQQEAEVDRSLSELNSLRQNHVGSVDRVVLARYDRVRVKRAGMGIVPAVAGRCKGCNMVLPPQLFNEIQKLREIHDCPSCHRILFAPAAPAPVGTP